MSLAPSLPTTSGTVSTDRSPATVRRVTRAAGIAAALVLVAVVWLVGSAAGADYLITDPTGSAVITLFTAVAFSLQVALLGWLVLAVLERFVRRARTVWTSLAVVMVAASMVPVALVEATATTAVALVVLHLAVGAVLVPVFARTSPRS